MKSLLTALILSGNIFVAVAQKSITICVEDLKGPSEKLEVTSYQNIVENLIRADSGKLHFHPGTEHINPKFDIVAQSVMPGKLVDLGYHPFFEGMYHAYAEHRPFTLSPDMIWLLICQGFSQHVNNNSESMRHLFVNFEGKTSLIVHDERISLDNPNSPWQDVFSDFSKQISDYTDKELTGTLTSDFSTTTLTTKMASQITLMNAMKSYFDFIVIRIGCGIPKITLEGTEQDWEKVLAKTEALRKYQLDWWVDGIEPVLKKMIAASQGEVDQAFWQSMFKYHSAGKCGSPTVVDGWIVKFFPYDKTGRRNSLDSLSLRDDLPDEIVKVDLTYKNGDGNGNFVTTPLELWAGFVGLRQNDESFELKPEIGWMIRKKSTGIDNEILKEQFRKGNSSQNSFGAMGDFGGIMIRVKTVPKELLEIGPIHSLTIYFTYDIQIPDEMDKIKIEKFKMYGKIDEAGIARICKLLPDTILIINDKQYTDGTPHDALKF